jgi:hypothetical protein
MRRPESLVPEALGRVRIYQAASQLGFYLPESPGSCRSPFREERRASFSWFVGRDGRDRWKDFGTGEGGDTLDFIMKGLRCPYSVAAKELLKMAGLEEWGNGPRRASALPPSILCTPKPGPKPIEPRRSAKEHLPADLHQGSARELSELIESRRWIASPEQLQEASETGALRFGTFYGERSWLLVDSQLRFFEARRLDAKPWGNGGKSNSRGSKSLLGVERLRPGCVCLFVEGAPDYLAGWILRAEAEKESCSFSSECFPVAALGASSSLSREDLAHFRGVRVLMFPHRDEAGQQACLRWKRELKTGGAEVREINLERFLIPGGKDLADCLNSPNLVELLFHCEGLSDLMREELK